MYTAKGLEPQLAAEVARQLHRDPVRALDVHTREELGVTLEDLPSPTLAATSSFLSFAAGALIPVLPYLLGSHALWPAAVMALLGLFVCGAVVTRLTSRPWWYGGLRQLVLGAAAATLTYAFGSLVGAGLG
jgi:VIT1/CCC1 family predicted Fe2+/Mn2+ transporter